MQNFSEAQHLTPIRDEGKVYSATNDGQIPFVSTEDIACVAKHLLTDKKSHNTDYVVLGPELLSYDDVSRHIFSCSKTSGSGENIYEKALSNYIPSKLAPRSIYESSRSYSLIMESEIITLSVSG